jgi:hypothetical protein
MKSVGLKAAVRVLFIGLAFMILSLAALAQGTRQQPQGSSVAESKVTGCLQPGKDHVTLTDGTGTTYLLKGKLGRVQKRREYVEVSGQQFAPTSGRGEAALPQIKVVKLRKLAKTCPVNLTPPPTNSVYNPTAPQSFPGTPAYDRPATAPGSEGAPVINSGGAGGAPSPGTGNPPPQSQR